MIGNCQLIDIASSHPIIIIIIILLFGELYKYLKNFFLPAMHAMPCADHSIFFSGPRSRPEAADGAPHLIINRVWLPTFSSHPWLSWLGQGLISATDKRR